MFVYPRRRSLTTIAGAAVTVSALALGACTAPTLRTDLRPEGDPEVLAVLVLSDSAFGLLETATYCAPGDEKRPSLVGLPDFTTSQVCDDDLSVGAEMAEAAPGAWYVRIMFDELLDPSIEELIPVLDDDDQPTGQFIGTLENTQPVTLRCEGVDGAMYDVPYDGYYSPSGNSVTWPLGPSLVIKPLDPTIVPVASACEVAIKPNTVKDKTGNFVPADQAGPFRFRTQPVEVIDVFPSSGTRAPDFMNAACVEVLFNVDIDPSTFDGDDVELSTAAGIENLFVDAAGDSAAYLCADDGFLDATEYAVDFVAGAKVTDHCGVETDLRVPSSFVSTGFATQPIRLVSITPAQGTGILPSRKIRLDFNQQISVASLEASEFTVDPPIANMALAAFGDGSIIVVNGNYQLGTEYTFTLNEGATIRDAFDTSDATTAAAQTVKFTTAPTIALAAQSPANGARVVEGATTTIRLTFTTEMDPTTVGLDEFTLTDASGAAVVGTTVDATTTGTSVAFTALALAPGSYTFTFKAGATVDDRLGNTYTQAADRVITFSIVEPPPPPPIDDFLCLGQTP